MAIALVFASCGSDDNSTAPTTESSTWTITFNANGGSITTPHQEVNKSTHWATLTSATNLGLAYSGHLFYAWNTQADGRGIFYADGSNDLHLTDNITLYAIWLNTSKTAATANTDGTYTVTPYNFEATLKAISESGATEASFIVTEAVNFKQNTVDKLNPALQKYIDVMVSIDLSKSTMLTSIAGTEYVVSGEAYKGFYSCKNLKKIILPEGLKSIGRNSFYGCTNLSSIILPASTTTISYNAFEKCTTLETVNYSGTWENWLTITFSNANANPNSVAWSNASENRITTSSFLIGGKTVQEVVIPSSITEIKDFALCKIHLQKVTIPNSVRKIGAAAFWYSDITTIEIPKSVTQISQSAFRSASLTTATFLDTESIWYSTGNSSFTNGTEIGKMTNPSTNATWLTSTYVNNNLYNTKYTAQ